MQRGRLFHYRSKAGAEIDFIVEIDDRFIPIEVKWTEHPRETDARHIIEFMRHLPDKARHGFVVCRCERPMQIHENILAIPYWAM